MKPSLSKTILMASVISTGSFSLSEDIHAAHLITRAPSVVDLADAKSRVSEPLQYYGKQIIVQDGEVGTRYNADVEGQVRVPIDGDGPFPVVLYLHGRHSTCEIAGGFEFLSAGECDLEEPRVLGQPIELLDGVDSYKGYDYMAENLAAHGYIVISIDANDVNDKDLAGDAGVFARSQLILHHLDILREINNNGQTTLLQDPYLLSEFRGKIDMSRIGIMGHSRGGQAVTNVLSVNRNRPATQVVDPLSLFLPQTFESHELTAVFALAPTNFDYIDSEGAHFAVLLPYCDGDVSNLQGAFMFDDGRPLDDGKEKFQIMPMGSNHNFYNTVWTSDDYSNVDTWCDLSAEGNRRDIPLDQQRHGEFMMSSFFRLFVGGEEKFAPFWYGNQSMPVDACPSYLEQEVAAGNLDEDAARKICDDRYHLSIMRPTEQRLVVDFIEGPESLQQNALMGVTQFNGSGTAEFCSATTANATNDSDACAGSARLLSTAGNILLTAEAGDTLSMGLQTTITTESSTSVVPFDASAFDSFTFRLATPIDVTEDNAPELKVQLTDSSGQQASVEVAEYSRAQYLPPGLDDNPEGAKSLFSMIKLPLNEFTEINSVLDTTALTQLAVISPTATKVHLTDFVFQNIGNPAPEKPVVEDKLVDNVISQPDVNSSETTTSESADNNVEVTDQNNTTSNSDSAEATGANSSSGSSGGALGLLSLIGVLALVGLRQRRLN